MKKIHLKKTFNVLILLSLILFSAALRARSPAVLPVRGLEIPDVNKKYPNGPPDLNKTSFLFDKGTPKILINQTTIATNEMQQTTRTTISLVVFAGVFALLAPTIYILFFRKGQKMQGAPVKLDRHLKIAKLPPGQEQKETERTEEIKKAS